MVRNHIRVDPGPWCESFWLISSPIEEKVPKYELFLIYDIFLFKNLKNDVNMFFYIFKYFLKINFIYDVLLFKITHKNKQKKKLKLIKIMFQKKSYF